MTTIKPKVWKRVLAEKDWGEKFNLLLDKDNYEEDEKYKSKISTTGKRSTKRGGLHQFTTSN